MNIKNQNRNNIPDEMLRELFNKSRDGYNLVNMKGEFLACNPAFEEMVQYSFDELKNMTVFDITPKKYHKLEMEKYVEGQLLKQGFSDRYEKEIIRKDGKIIPIEISLYTHKAEGSEASAVMAIVRDISSHHKNLEDFKASEKLLNLTQNAAMVGGWELDIESGKQKWTKQTYAIHEVDDDFHPTLESGLSFFKGEYYKIISNAINALIENKQEYDLQLVLTTANGNEKWVECLGRYLEDEKGNVCKIYGTIQDISREKKTEIALKQSREEYKSLQENIPIGIFRTNPAGEILHANSELLNMFAYDSVDDLNQVKVTALYSESKDRLAFKNMLEENGIVQNFNVRMKKRDGSNFWASLNAKANFNDRAEVTLYDGSIRDISEQYESTKALQESEEKFRSLYKSLKDAIIVTDPNRRIIDCNPAFSELFGYELREIEGQPTRILYENEEQFLDVGKKIKENLNGSTPFFYSVKYKKKNGDLFPGETGIFYLQNENGKINGYIGSIRDNTEKKEAENKIKQANEDLRLQNAKNVALLNGARNILRYNNFEKTSKSLFDYCKELTGAASGYVALLSDGGEENEVLFLDSGGLPCNVNPALPMPVRGLREKAYASGKVVYDNDFMNSEWVKYMPEGHVRLDNVMFAPLEIAGKVKGIMGLANKNGDFTEEDAQIASAFGDLAALALHNSKTMDDLVQAKEKAEEADRLKTAFISNMSHEIRTPMNAIVGFSDFLSDHHTSEEERIDYVKIIQDNATMLTQIIDDILDVAKIEAGELKIERIELEVNEQLRVIFDSVLKGLVQKHGSGISRELLLEDPDCKILIHSDPVRLRQIFTNLLSNAFKFTEQGTITMGYTIQEKETIRFFVRDTGIGIPQDQQAIIFDRFRQVDGSNTRKYGGTGIGLTITKSLVELLGGQIHLYSEPGKGSQFSFELPLLKIEKEPEPEQTGRTGKSNAFLNLEGKKILVAEDADSNYEYLKTMLGIMNANVIWARNGKEAIDKIKENKDISMVLMDIQMPVLSGYDATKEIRKFNRDLPIIAQTAFASENDKKNCMEAGCNEYITKPIRASALINLIRKNLVLI